MRLARRIRDKLTDMINQKVSKQRCRYTIKRCGCIQDEGERLVTCARHTNKKEAV